jgi:protein-arginine kinase activator protein McsA
MRSVLLLFISLILCTKAHSQSLLQYNVTELKTEQKKSLETEDFERAAKIQKEIQIFQKLDSLKSKFNSQLKAYLEQEDYAKSASVKTKIEKCDRLFNIPNDLKIALNENNYQQAQVITSEVHTLRFELLGIPHAEVNKSVPAVNPEILPENKNVTTVDPNPSKQKKHRFTFYSGLMITLPRVIIDDTLTPFTGFKSRAAAGVSFGLPIGQTGFRIIAGSDVKSYRTVITDDKYPGLIIGQEISKSWQFAYHFGIDYSIVINDVTISPGVIMDKGVAYQGDLSNSSITSSEPINYYGPNIIGEPGLNYEKNNVQPQVTIQYNKKNVGVYAKYRHGTSILNPEPDVSKSRFYLSCLELGITIKRK